MRILFVHQNFPGQFRHITPALAARGDEVVGMGMRDPGAFAGVSGFDRIRYVQSVGSCGTATDGHPFTRDFDSKVIRGEATLRSAIGLKEEGFSPDVIFAHPAWGEPMFLPEVWPEAKMLLYCEMLYRLDGLDTNFDPEFTVREDNAIERARLMIRCLPQRLLWDHATAGICPTDFQAATFPEPMRGKISVIHDGVDTDIVRPATPEGMRTGTGREFRPGDEVITFVNRNLEPLRGFHRFMRALPALLRRRPRAQVIIVGGDGVSYGPAPEGGGSWKQWMLDEMGGAIDLARVHFVGQVPYPVYLNILRMSQLHFYLTYPFVASWSLLEAMAAGAPILASDTQPVLEFITHGETGLLVDFFDGDALVDQACRILEDRALADRLSANARALAIEKYDLKTVCLPRQIAWLDRVSQRG